MTEQRYQNNQPIENISGIIERITYHNPETGFCVLRVRVKGQRDLVTITSQVPLICAGEFIQASGHWFNDRDHGLQFKAAFLKATAPNTLEGLEKYLGSGMIKGIGPIYAKKLVDTFGENVFDVIEQEPHRLKSVSGIGKGRQEIILKGWRDQKAIREIMLFLHSNGISTTRAVRIYKTYGHEAINVITNNPYRLAQDIRGIGFVSADKIAQQMGIALDAMIRVRAGISYALAEMLEEGHCGYPQDQLITQCCTLLNLESQSNLVEEALNQELFEGIVVKEVIGHIPCIFLKGLAVAEEVIANRIVDLSQGSVPWSDINADNAINWVQQKNDITLSNTQQQAIKQALCSKVFIITGGPGVGKTTLVKSILSILQAKGVKIELAAPTGRAAKRLTETTGLPAKTLHRLLSIGHGHNDYHSTTSGYVPQADQLKCDLLIVDETSMVDVMLMHKILKSLPERAALFLVGDVDQLPSVGPGQVLFDLLDCQMIAAVRLTEIFRQASHSQIITVAHEVNQGRMPDLINHDGHKDDEDQTPASKSLPITKPASDFYFIPAETPEQASETILKLVTHRIPQAFKLSPFQDIQVLCPMTRGVIGTRNLNILIQQALHPEATQTVQRFGTSYQVNDKVMQIQNNYDKDVFNGDIGMIKSIDHQESEVTVTFDQCDVIYDFNELDELILAYATTVHKSQGSEYPAIIIPLMTQHYPMLQKKLVYTGITRGKKLVIIVGQKKAMGIALNYKNDLPRWSSLKHKLLRIKNGGFKN